MEKFKDMFAEGVERAKVMLKANKVAIVAFIVGVVVGAIVI